MRAVEDANRKRDEHDWRWRLFYERFAQQQNDRSVAHADRVIGPLAVRERQEEETRMAALDKMAQ